jgi:hypothetical protein
VQNGGTSKNNPMTGAKREEFIFQSAFIIFQGEYKTITQISSNSVTLKLLAGSSAASVTYSGKRNCFADRYLLTLRQQTLAWLLALLSNIMLKMLQSLRIMSAT